MSIAILAQNIPLYLLKFFQKPKLCAEEDWGSACHVCRMVLVMRELRRVLRDDGTLWMNYGDSYSSGGSTRVAGGGVFDKGRPSVRPGDGGKERWKEGHQYEIPVAGRKNHDHRSSVVHKPGYKQPFRRGTAGDKAQGSPYLEQGKMTGGSSGLPAGNLVGVPWRVALAMQADGWILRQDIIWHKPSPMPESVQNRCTKAHEYVFLFSKRQQYFYDAEAIKVPMTPEQSEVCRRTVEDAKKKKRHEVLDASGNGAVARVDRYAATTEAYAPTGANKRSTWSVDDHKGLVEWMIENDPDAFRRFIMSAANKTDLWSVSSRGYEGAHFATFAEALITPMIKAGTSEKGCCGALIKKLRVKNSLTHSQRTRLNEFLKRRRIV